MRLHLFSLKEHISRFFDLAAQWAFRETDKGQVCYFPLLFHLQIQEWIIIVGFPQGDNMRSSVPRFTFKWNQMAVHTEMIYSNDDGNKSKVLFHIGPAPAWNCCRLEGIFRYSRWVMSLLCQDYYLNVSTSRFISILPKRLNVVSNQPCSSLALSVCRVAEWGL